MEEESKKKTELKPKPKKKVGKWLLRIAIVALLLFLVFQGLGYYSGHKAENKIENEMYDNLNKADNLLLAIELNEQTKLISDRFYNISEQKRLNRERQRLLYSVNNDLSMGVSSDFRMNYVKEQIEHIKRVKDVEYRFNLTLRNTIEISALEEQPRGKNQNANKG